MFCCLVPAGDQPEVGHAEVRDLVAVGEIAHRAELLLGGGQADLETGDFAKPALLKGLGDALAKVGDDLTQARLLSRVRAQGWAPDVPLTETVRRSWWCANVNAT